MQSAVKTSAQRSFPVLCVLLFFLLVAAAEAKARDIFQQRLKAVDDAVMVATGSTSVEISFSKLQSNDSPIPGTLVSIARQPFHGSLQVQGSSFIYTLEDGFRSLRHDSFAYTLMAPGGALSTATVHLFRKFPSDSVLFQGFEDADPINYVPGPGYLENLIVTSAAALVGSYGLRVFAPAGESEPGYLTFVPGTDTTDDGGTTLLGCGLSIIPEGRAVLITLGLAGQGPEEAVARVAIERWQGQVPRLFAEVRRADGTGYTSSPGVAVSTEVTNLAIEWFQGGITLEVDGLATTNLDPDNAPMLFTHFQVGILSASGFGTNLQLDFDQVEFFAHPSLPPPAPLLLSDGFETTGSAPWTQVVGAGISESSAKVITGSRSLRLDLGLLGDAYRVGNTGAGGERFGTRFRLDPSGISLGAGDSVQILGIGTGQVSGPGDLRYSLEIQEVAGVPQIRMLAHRAGLTTPWIALSTSQVHGAALQVGAASSPGLDNGYLRLWLDGAVAGEFFALGNTGEVIGWVRLGAEGVGLQSVGALLFDDFAAWE